MENNNQNQKMSGGIVIMLVISWLVVGIPAVWGVTQTIRESKKLFTGAPPPTTAPATGVER